MARELQGRKVAILATNGVEQVELTGPREALEEAGAETVLIAPEPKSIRAWNQGDWGETFEVDVRLDRARPDDYDALVLPGGVMSPDRLRMDDRAVAFVRSFVGQGRPVAAICHAPWLLVEAGVVRGRRLTSYPSLKTDARNAGADWVDEEVVVDDGLVTGRRPADLPAFNHAMIREIGRYRRREAA